MTIPCDRSELVPLITKGCCNSIALIMSSPATVSMLIAAKPESIVISRSPWPVLPALLVTLAVADRVPLANPTRCSVGTSTDQVPSAFTVVVYSLPFRETFTCWPASALTTRPLIVWFIATSAAFRISSPPIVLIIMTGAAVLTTILWLSVTVLPAESLPVTVRTYWLSINLLTSTAGTVTVHRPFSPTVVR